MQKRSFIRSVVAAAAALTVMSSMAQDNKFRIGLILPMTGPFASTGRQIENGVRLYMAQYGDKVAGRMVEIVLKDDTGVPDIS